MKYFSIYVLIKNIINPFSIFDLAIVILFYFFFFLPLYILSKLYNYFILLLISQCNIKIYIYK